MTLEMGLFSRFWKCHGTSEGSGFSIFSSALKVLERSGRGDAGTPEGEWRGSARSRTCAERGPFAPLDAYSSLYGESVGGLDRAAREAKRRYRPFGNWAR